jgi:nitrate/nitrite transporter NarK
MDEQNAAYSNIISLINTSNPSPGNSGTVNGLGGIGGSCMRAVGPWLATSAFAYTIRYNLMGGLFVYFLLTSIALILCLASWTLLENERPNQIMLMSPMHDR